jgi:hypothetical protein
MGKDSVNLPSEGKHTIMPSLWLLNYMYPIFRRSPWWKGLYTWLKLLNLDQFRNLMYVVGATEYFVEIHCKLYHTVLLVPGVGAQGVVVRSL